MMDLQRQLLACQKKDEPLTIRERVEVSNSGDWIRAIEDNARSIVYPKWFHQIL